jgi:hypothetical protein
MMKQISIKLLFIFLIVFIIQCDNTIENKVTKWDNGIIPYIFCTNITESERTTIRSVMDEWEKDTNIKFVPFKSQDNCLAIIEVDSQCSRSTFGCNSEIDNYVKISAYNFKKYVVAHELGHAIGLKHEHQRKDRDMYIKINYENIIDGYSQEFAIEDNPFYDTMILDYDSESIMHYPPHMFSNGEGLSFESLMDGVETKTLGGFNISALDREKVNLIYPHYYKYEVFMY